MKKFISIVLVGVSLFFGAKHETYARSGKVISIDYETDTVTFIDSVGYEWSFKGTEDWMVDDGISCVMDNNFTEDIRDDKIVSYRYVNLEALN